MRKHRSKCGTMYVLILCVSALIFIPLLMLLSRLGPLFVASGRAQNVVEAAGKIAAMDLSRIVINDPEFGYVSLSNHQPVGTATRARDGEPLPVIGINTLVGTLRFDAIIADELHNDTMKTLNDKDLDALDETIKNLNAVLGDSLKEGGRKQKCIDINGALVDPVEDVRSFLTKNLPANTQLESVKLSLGWLDGGSETGIAVPMPASMAQVTTRDMQAGQYEAFTNYPVAKRSFTFAGLAPQTHLVSTKMFRDDDGKHICSIVKIECTVVSQDEAQSKIQCVACCQAYTHPDSGTCGAMTVRFWGRPVPGLMSWKDFLTAESFHDNKLTRYDITGGDYPFDRKAFMKDSEEQESKSSTAKQFAEHLYNWLRNGRTRPRIDAVLAMMNEPFQSRSREVYTYEFEQDGSINRHVSDAQRFTPSVTADGQFVTMSDTRTKHGASAVIIFRDNVQRLNTETGNHGGQPLAGYPLSDMLGAIDYERVSSQFSKRKTFQQGLALDIEIGGTNESTAANDVLSMRERTRHRRI
jgi:hypothetical protein